jgi:hypothetical protein
MKHSGTTIFTAAMALLAAKSGPFPSTYLIAALAASYVPAPTAAQAPPHCAFSTRLC